MSYGGHIAAIIAAKKAQEQKKAEQHEEEQLTKYNENDLEKYEFKIVRSQWGKFKDLQTIQNLCAEEAKSGWEMVEKFDNHRIRFKRAKTMRSSDNHQTIDPYRTAYDGTATGKFFLIFGILLALFGAAVAFFATGGYIEVTNPAPLIFLILLIIGIVGLIIAKKKSKQNRPF